MCDLESIRDWPGGYVYAQVPLWRYGIDLSCWNGLTYASTLGAHEVAWAAPLVCSHAQRWQHTEPSSSNETPPRRTSGRRDQRGG